MQQLATLGVFHRQKYEDIYGVFPLKIGFCNMVDGSLGKGLVPGTVCLNTCYMWSTKILTVHEMPWE